MNVQYGMRLRPFGPETAPMQGLLGWMDTDKVETGYWSVLWYDRILTEQETARYDLEAMN